MIEAYENHNQCGGSPWRALYADVQQCDMVEGADHGDVVEDRKNPSMAMEDDRGLQHAGDCERRREGST